MIAIVLCPLFLQSAINEGTMDREAQSVWRLDTGWKVQGSNGARFSAPVQTGPGAHPASCTMGTESFPGVERIRGVTLTPHPLLVPRSKNECRSIPLLSLRAFVACKKGETYLQWTIFLPSVDINNSEMENYCYSSKCNGIHCRFLLVAYKSSFT
jgi:hypothetical protein